MYLWKNIPNIARTLRIFHNFYEMKIDDLPTYQNIIQYLKGKKDIVENSRRYLDHSRESAMSLVKKINNWVRVDCQREGQLLSKKEVNNLIWESLIKKGIGL